MSGGQLCSAGQAATARQGPGADARGLKHRQQDHNQHASLSTTQIKLLPSLKDEEFAGQWQNLGCSRSREASEHSLVTGLWACPFKLCSNDVAHTTRTSEPSHSVRASHCVLKRPGNQLHAATASGRCEIPNAASGSHSGMGYTPLIQRVAADGTASAPVVVLEDKPRSKASQRLSQVRNLRFGQELMPHV